MRWISCTFFYDLDRTECYGLITQFFKVIDRWIVRSGPVWTIKRMKAQRNIITRYICGDPIMLNKDNIGVDRDGFPLSIIFLKEFIDSGNLQKRRFVMTLQTLSRSINVRGEVKLNSITDPFTGEVKTIDYEFIEQFVKDNNIDQTHDGFSQKNMFFTFKGGIYGKQLWTAVQSFKDWTGTMHACALLLGSTSFMKWIEYYKAQAPSINEKTRTVSDKMDKRLGGHRPLRRLHIVSDPEQKERVICIFDYMSQVLFEPLSLKLFETLRRLPQDRTFTQDPIIKNKKDPESKYYSFDLSAATDRFPVILQRDLLKAAVFGNIAYADAWRIMMTRQQTVDHKGNPIAYAVGQPMGARSSWSMFTLSHHLVVQYAAKKAGCYPTNQYILLGDDIVIYDDNVAREYQLIIEKLGVEISKTKSHISKDTYEFAKRWFKDGSEFSGVQINAILSTSKNPIGLFEVIRQQIQRGYIIVAKPAETTASQIKLFRRSKNSVKYTNYVTQRMRSYLVISRNLAEFNYDEVREFVANATATNEYQIPSSERDLKNEFLRVVNTQYCYQLTSMHHQLASYSKWAFEHIQMEMFSADVDHEIVAKNPLLISLENLIMEISPTKIMLDDWKDGVLKDKITSQSLFDLDLIRNTSRKSEANMLFLAKFASNLYTQWREYPDQNPHPSSWGQAALGVLNSKKAFRATANRKESD